MGKKVEEINYSIEDDAKKRRIYSKQLINILINGEMCSILLFKLNKKNPVIFIVLYIDNI